MTGLQAARTVKWFNYEQGLAFITPDDPARTPSGLHNKGRTGMASSGKKKTTMAKLTRERKLRERRVEKQAKKEARKQASAHPAGQPSDALAADDREAAVGSDAGESPGPVVEARDV